MATKKEGRSFVMHKYTPGKGKNGHRKYDSKEKHIPFFPFAAEKKETRKKGARLIYLGKNVEL